MQVKAKTLIFEEVEPFLNRYREAAKINVLKHLDGTPASYNITKDLDGTYTAGFFCMDRGLWLGSFSDIEKARQACQDHYDAIVRENAEVIV